ncbi:MAG TPA: hypothetical protein VM096_12450 [Vicinamibacterales bacterium]|nr:hypothetical protein [Vicinamibacterales bacterium]
MRAAKQVTAWLQLTRLFLRQFLENDLVSPDSDRAQLLAVVGAGVVSLTLFISMFLSAPYSMSRLTPGQAAVLTLNDKFFYVSLAMLVTALIAAAQWDALALDHRDSAILDPLPIRPAIVRAAKLTAVAILGAVAAIAVNVFPTFVFPWMLSFSVRQMSAVDVFRLMAIHAMVTVTSAVFGYLAVMAFRETLSALLGPKLFTRWSPSLQASTIVVLGSLLLLLPPASTRTAQRGFTGWWAQLPSMSFVALYEVASREFIIDLPRTRMSPRMAARDPEPTALYAQRRPLFAPMAQRVELLLGGTVATLVIATVISGLRAPIGGALLLAGGRRRSRVFHRIANTLIVRHPAARAGFHFAFATLFRSKTHRLTLACAAAAALSMMLFVLSRTDLQVAKLTPGLLSLQPLLYGSLLVAFRHLVRIPAELRANWGVQLAWRDHVRRFNDGVALAGLASLAVPAILIVVPLVSWVSSPSMALVHAAVGVLGAMIVVEALMLGWEKPAFVCSYVPGAAKALVPMLVMAFFIGANAFARVELGILNGNNVIRNVVLLIAIYGGLRVASIRRRDPQIDFNEGPETFSQLSLHN